MKGIILCCALTMGLSVAAAADSEPAKPSYPYVLIIVSTGPGGIAQTAMQLFSSQEGCLLARSTVGLGMGAEYVSSIHMFCVPR